MAEALLQLRRRHPTWGGKKLLAVLARRCPGLTLPAPSTVAASLTRAGLVTPRRRRRTLGHPGRPTAPMDAPNAIWTADFKGEFKTRDGVGRRSRQLGELGAHGLRAEAGDGGEQRARCRVVTLEGVEPPRRLRDPRGEVLEVRDERLHGGRRWAVRRLGRRPTPRSTPAERALTH